VAKGFGAFFALIQFGVLIMMMLSFTFFSLDYLIVVLNEMAALRISFGLQATVTIFGK
jgi:hypothetical protein